MAKRYVVLLDHEADFAVTWLDTVLNHPRVPLSAGEIKRMEGVIESMKDQGAKVAKKVKHGS